MRLIQPLPFSPLKIDWCVCLARETPPIAVRGPSLPPSASTVCSAWSLPVVTMATVSMVSVCARPLGLAGTVLSSTVPTRTVLATATAPRVSETNLRARGRWSHVDSEAITLLMCRVGSTPDELKPFLA